jgi:four helix bundle protein
MRVWNVADQLAHEVYRVTRDFPKEEQFGLTSQLRRAAISVPTNLVEGHARKSRKEFKQFVSVALGSLAEVEYLLTFAKQEAYLPDKTYETVESVRRDTGRLLWGFYESL